jgi:hypothetical protein
MAKRRGYNELDLPRDGSDPEVSDPPVIAPTARGPVVARPPTLDARALWRSVTACVVTLDGFGDLDASPWTWTEHVELDARYEHGIVTHGDAAIEVTFTSRIVDTHAGPRESERAESLRARLGSRVIVEITRQPPAAPRVVMGPDDLAKQIDAALARLSGG